MIDYYKLLDLLPTATFKEVKERTKDLKQRYEREINLGENIEALQSQLDLISEAQEILLDSDERESYDEELAATPQNKIEVPFAEEYIDYSAIRQSAKTYWKDLINWSDEPIENYRQLLTQTVSLPDESVQSPILLAAMLTPSTLANMMPIVHSYGVSGCGKSQISKLTCKLWGGNPEPGVTSYATLRRVIAGNSQRMAGGRSQEVNNALCWDDVSPELLKNPGIYSLLKSACDRATSIIKISKGQTDTEVVEFECFGGRFISSIYPFFGDSSFSEMNRRTLVIKCEKFKSKSTAINYNKINWSGLKEYNNLFWQDKMNRDYYFQSRNDIEYIGGKKDFVSPERLSLCLDLLATGMTLGIWDTHESALTAIAKFYTLNDVLIGSMSDPLRIVLKKLTDCSNGQISATSLKDVVDNSVKTGLIDRRINKGDVRDIMTGLGWTLNVLDRLWHKI